MSNKVIDLLNKLAFHLESVAHLRGLERELLPLCEEARAMADALSAAAPQAKRAMGELMDEYEEELIRLSELGQLGRIPENTL